MFTKNINYFLLGIATLGTGACNNPGEPSVNDAAIEAMRPTAVPTATSQTDSTDSNYYKFPEDQRFDINSCKPGLDYGEVLNLGMSASQQACIYTDVGIEEVCSGVPGWSGNLPPVKSTGIRSIAICGVDEDGDGNGDKFIELPLN